MIRKKEQAIVRKVDDVEMFNYITLSDELGFSLAKGEINGHHGMSRNVASARAYFICSGDGSFEIDDEIFSVIADDVVFVPVGSPHRFEGHFNYVVVNVPPFNPSDEIG